MIYCFLVTNMPLHVRGLGGEKSIGEFQRGQIHFPHYLHSHNLAACFLLPELLFHVHSVQKLHVGCSSYEFAVKGDKVFGTNVVNPSVWIRGCRVTGSLDSSLPYNVAIL